MSPACPLGQREDACCIALRGSKAVKVKSCPDHHLFVETSALRTFPSLILTFACGEAPSFRQYCPPCGQGHGAL